MSEAAERVEAWRRAKRHEGYRQVALWLPADFKGKLDALAYARHQDIATCVMDAVEYLEHKQGTLKPLRLDAHQQRRLEEKITTTSCNGSPRSVSSTRPLLRPRLLGHCCLRRRSRWA